MGQDKIKLNFAAMQEMKQHCEQVAQRLLETEKLGVSIAAQMEGGALVGDAGARFADALRNGFKPPVHNLSEKFKEVARDIQAAMDAMDSEDNSAGKAFQGGRR